MRFARVDHKGKEQYAVVENNCVCFVTGDIFTDWQYTGEKLPLDAVKLLAPVKPETVLCIGRNYKAHAEECGNDLPKAPMLFIKANSSVCGQESKVAILPEYTQKVDYESELAVIIGKTAKSVPEEKALEYVFGFTCANDISARDCQYADGQWARGKSFDNFCPLGPWIETGLDPSDLEITGRRNGKVVQHSRTSLMIFSVSYLISYLSRTMTLLPGTVILTGTPSGVINGEKESPCWLEAGEEFEVEISGIGVLKSTFV